MMPMEQFVPNDIRLDGDERVIILTGPNMAGKSTILRQVGLITLMAQMGSYVPADAAEVGVTDRIFTRVGASDNLAQGHSTFMVEMIETAAILNGATHRSLVLLDEIGREYGYELEVIGEWIALYVGLMIQLLYNWVILWQLYRSFEVKRSEAKVSSR